LQVPSKNNNFSIVVLGELFENLQLLSQLELVKMAAGSSKLRQKTELVGKNSNYTFE